MRRFRALIAGLTIAIGLSADRAGRGGERAALGERGRGADRSTPMPTTIATDLGPAPSGLRGPLIGFDSNLDLVPRLAVAWRLVEPTVWEFELRPNVRFHDGTSVTAADVVFSFARARTELPAGLAGRDREHRRGARDRRAHRAHRDQVPRPAAAGQGAPHLHHVGTLGGGARRPGPGERQRGRGELRVAARQRHRPVHPEGVRAQRAGCHGAQPGLVGLRALSSQHRPDRVHPDRRSRSSASPRCSGATSTC